MGASAKRVVDAARRPNKDDSRPSQLDALKAFVENTPLAVAMTDESLRFLAVSPQWVADFAVPGREMLGKTSYEAAPDTERFRAAHDRVLGGETLRGEPEIVRLPNGEERWMSWSASPWRERDGRVGGILLISRDMTDLVEAQDEARRSRTLASIVVEHSPLPMVIKNADGRVLMMNRAMQRLYGVPDDHRGQKAHEVMDSAFADAVVDEDRRVLESGETLLVEERRTLPGFEGERVLRKTKAAIRDDNGGTYIVAISEDVTAAARVRDALENTRAFLATVIDNIPVGLTVKRAADGRLLLANQAVADIFGFDTADENLGCNAEDVFDPELARRMTERERELVRAGGSRFYEADEITTRAGHRHINQLKTLVSNGQGEDFILTITEDVTERKLADDALAQALARAEAASVAKSEFLANMSHEIRTPLNGVLGLADALARMDLRAEQREIVDMIVGSGHALTAILSDVLDLAKAEAGQLQLSREPFSLRETIGSAAFLFETVARGKGVAFAVEFDADGPDRFIGDSLRIRQVVSNLISNAVKFTTQGEVRITVAARPALGGSARLSVKVKDTGPGFSEEVREKLFSRFEQGDGSITRRYGGTGLGLSIAGALALKMGGQIDCRARPGVGATFIFRAQLELDAAPVVELATPAEAAPARLGQKLRVLLAEDHEVNQKVVSLMLGDAAELVVVADGQGALDHALGPHAFDVILMDTQMPVMDGLTATRRIREEELRQGLARTPIVSLTANAMTHQVQAALEAGADHHLAKPITVDALFAAIERALEPAARGPKAAVA
jgi:PAS domain S-box-containing protein